MDQSESEYSLPAFFRLPANMQEETCNYWLMKAEPDSRVVKGKDVKFSVDDFEAVGTTPWEGVRNYEARNLMKEMVLGDKILFYHSNCKNPGVAGFAEVSKEAYPDYTAWDSTHPYFDEKSDKDNPRWFMVDVKFVSRARHFIPLSLLRHIAALPPTTPSEAVSYVKEDDIDAIKAMPLVTRGRLSVQRVPAACWDVIQTMADKGGWETLSFPKKATKVCRAADGTRSSTTRKRVKYSGEQHVGGARRDNERGKKLPTSTSPEDAGQDLPPRRRSLRSKR